MIPVGDVKRFLEPAFLLTVTWVPKIFTSGYLLVEIVERELAETEVGGEVRRSIRKVS